MDSSTSVGILKEMGLNSVQQLKLLRKAEALRKEKRGLAELCRDLQQQQPRRRTNTEAAPGDASLWLKAQAAKVCFGPDCDTSIARTDGGGVLSTTGGLQIGAVDDARCAGAGDAGIMRWNDETKSVEVCDGEGTWGTPTGPTHEPTAAPTAAPTPALSGGDEVQFYSDGSTHYEVRLFYGSGTLSVGTQTTVDFLLVAGGGGGGCRIGGGGGGGSVLHFRSVTVKAGDYSVVVGAGGAGGHGSSTCHGSKGGVTSLLGQIAYGGGGGGPNTQLVVDDGDVGNGGGGSANGRPANRPGGAGHQPSSPNLVSPHVETWGPYDIYGGNTGGFGSHCDQANGHLAGGGAGAGGAGGVCNGKGGVGVSIPITSPAYFYGGGGGGSNYDTYTSSHCPAATLADGWCGDGGVGGGGGGGTNHNIRPGAANRAGCASPPCLALNWGELGVVGATSVESECVGGNGGANTGGGGGGGAHGSGDAGEASGGDGGSGVVIVRIQVGEAAPAPAPSGPTSCRELDVAGGTGSYQLDLDGSGATAVYCMMSILGGGWTKALYFPSVRDLTKDAVNGDLGSTQNAVGKLSDAVINKLLGSGNKEMLAVLPSDSSKWLYVEWGPGYTYNDLLGRTDHCQDFGGGSMKAHNGAEAEATYTHYTYSYHTSYCFVTGNPTMGIDLQNDGDGRSFAQSPGTGQVQYVIFVRDRAPAS